MFENRVLRRLFGPKRDEVTEEWRKLHNEELNDLYSSPIIIMVIKPRRMRWAEHVAHWGRGGVYAGFWWGKQRERDHVEHPQIGGRIILRWIIREWDGGHGLDQCGSGEGQVAGTCKCGNESLGSIKSGEFFY